MTIEHCQEQVEPMGAYWSSTRGHQCYNRARYLYIANGVESKLCGVHVQTRKRWAKKSKTMTVISVRELDAPV